MGELDFRLLRRVRNVEIALGGALAIAAAAEADSSLLTGGGGAPALNVVTPAGNYDAANGDYVLVGQGLVCKIEVTAGSPILKAHEPVFTQALVGCPLVPNSANYLPPGLVVLSVESDTELTMSGNGIENEEEDGMAFGAIITLPAPTAGHSVVVKRASGSRGSEGVVGHMLLIEPSSGLIDAEESRPLLGQWATAALVADGVNWTVQSEVRGAGAVQEGTGIACSLVSHAEGDATLAAANTSHAEGSGTKALGPASHAEGIDTEAQYSAHAEGEGSKAMGSYSHAEGGFTQALGAWSHAEGKETIARGVASHAVVGAADAWADWYWAISSGIFQAGQRSQYAFWVPYNRTTDATPTPLGVGAEGNAVGAPGVFDLQFPDGRTTMLVEARVVARSQDDDVASAWDITALYTSHSSEPRIVGEPKKVMVAQDAGASTWDCELGLSAGTPHGVQVMVTGEAGKGILWSCTLKLYEVAE